MARKTKASCGVGRKGNGQLKKGYKFLRGGKVVKARATKRKAPAKRKRKKATAKSLFHPPLFNV